MNVFLETLSVVGATITAIVLGIVALAVFFTLFGKMMAGGPDPDLPLFEGSPFPDGVATVHMSGGTVYENVRIVGVSEEMPPFQPFGHGQGLGMVILEDEEGRRILVRANRIQTIVYPPEDSSTSGEKSPFGANDD